jgi:hypothetical protein
MRKYADKLTPQLTGYQAPEIRISGLTVTTPMGTRGPKGEPLEEDFVFEFDGPQPHKTYVQGILIRYKETGKTALLVDVVSPTDPPYEMSPDDPFEWITWLWVLRIPAGETNLENCDMSILRCVTQLSEKKEAVA